MQTSPISTANYDVAHYDVINRGMSRDTTNRSRVVKQVKVLLIPNKWEQKVLFCKKKLHQTQFFAGCRLIIKSQALTHLSMLWKHKSNNSPLIKVLQESTIARFGQTYDLAGYWVTELTLLIRSQFSLRLNCYEILWLYIYKSRLQGIQQSFYGNYPKNYFFMRFQYNHIEYG